MENIRLASMKRRSKGFSTRVLVLEKGCKHSVEQIMGSKVRAVLQHGMGGETSGSPG